MTEEITLYGFGYVGKAVFNFLKGNFKLYVRDLNPEAGKAVESPHVFVAREEDLPKTKYAVVCVPTAMGKDGSCDTSAVESVIKNSHHEFYLIKSTIVPGTTERLVKETGKNIAFSP